MGLGKTLMTIGLMISNPPPRDEQHKATLIVCSPGLLVQCEFGIVACPIGACLTWVRGAGDREAH